MRTQKGKYQYVYILCFHHDIFIKPNGGIPEVLNYGEYGYLVERPNFIEDWIDAIEYALKNVNDFQMNLPKGVYDMDAWCEGMNEKIKSAKLSLA